jgi:predicted  nucleic acid-binding Zn-ribbon protein
MDKVAVFFQLKEYDSLCREHVSLLKQKSDLIDRLKTRQGDLLQAKSDLQELIDRYKSIDRDIIEIDRTLSQRLSDESKAENEEKALNLLIAQQEVEVAREEKKTFLVGFEKTVEEITQESNEGIQDLERKIAHLKSRMTQLFSDLPEDFRSLVERVQAKNLSIGIFTKVQEGKCAMCRHKLSLDMQSDIDQKLILKACPGCSRLFLPYSVVSGSRV